MLSLISDHNRGTPEDKMRLFLIYYLISEKISSSDLEMFTEALSKAGVDISPLKFVKK